MEKQRGKESECFSSFYRTDGRRVWVFVRSSEVIRDRRLLKDLDSTGDANGIAAWIEDVPISEEKALR
jgi:hypothetical protein